MTNGDDRAATLETDRLILRPHREEDLSAYERLWLPPARGPAFTPVLDLEGAWARLLRLVGHRAVFGFAPWLAWERSSGRLVGEVGLARFHRGLGADFDDVPEAMWILAPEARGRGLAGEAMGAALADADRRRISARCVCMIDPDNAVSMRLAAALGFRPYREALRHDRGIVLFERHRPD